MKVLAILQARYNSHRLPGKALLPIRGKPMIAHVLERALAIGFVDKVCVATASWPEDEPLIRWLEGTPREARFGVKRFSEIPTDDVLRRFAATLEVYDDEGFDTIMRLTGDCPFLDPRLCEDVLRTYQFAHAQFGTEYVSNACPGYLDGTDCEVFSAEALRWADREATQPYDREHVTPWMRRHVNVRWHQELEHFDWLKVSIDTEDELHAMRRLADYLPVGDYSRAATVEAAHRACLYPVESL